MVAQTEEDFQATVAFAQQYNLRLVVKGTGHDWYGRSAAAGSLMLWTHARSNITFIDAWTPQVKLGHPLTGHSAKQSNWSRLLLRRSLARAWPPRLFPL